MSIVKSGLLNAYQNCHDYYMFVRDSVKSLSCGAINEAASPILDRLGLNSDVFIEHVSAPIEKQVHPLALGSIDKLKALAESWKQKFIRCQSYSLRLYKVQ